MGTHFLEYDLHKHRGMEPLGTTNSSQQSSLAGGWSAARCQGCAARECCGRWAAWGRRSGRRGRRCGCRGCTRRSPRGEGRGALSVASANGTACPLPPEPGTASLGLSHDGSTRTATRQFLSIRGIKGSCFLGGRKPWLICWLFVAGSCCTI